jgi:hypothetical protein
MEAVVTAVQALTAADNPARVQVWDWTRLDAEQAAEAWKELLDWMRAWLAPRVPQLLDSGLRPWQSCWYRHPDVLDAG